MQLSALLLLSKLVEEENQHIDLRERKKKLNKWRKQQQFQIRSVNPENNDRIVFQEIFTTSRVN